MSKVKIHDASKIDEFLWIFHANPQVRGKKWRVSFEFPEDGEMRRNLSRQRRYFLLQIFGSLTCTRVAELSRGLVNKNMGNACVKQILKGEQTRRLLVVTIICNWHS